MAQIKVLKINAAGFPEEHGAADDLSFATLTAATQVAVTSGVTLTNNIAFNAVTDTIAGIQNQNLVDKTSAETISGNWTIATGFALTITDAPTAATDAINKAYADSLIYGLDWQDSVLDQNLTAPPGSPTAGDRYIVATGGTGAWAGQDGNIAEYNGTSWVFKVPNEGFAAWVEDENIIYIYNGVAWVKMASVYDHNDLAGLQGGTTNQYYHMTSTEDTWLAAALVAVPNGSNLPDKANATSISGNWTFTGNVDISGGDLKIPSAAAGVPSVQDAYFNAGTGKFYIHDGVSYVEIGSGGIADVIESTYTGGAGGIAQYDAVYISGNDTVLKGDAVASSTARVIGFAPLAITAASSGKIRTRGILAGILSGAVAGDPYYLASGTPGTITTTPPTGSGRNVILVGTAKNATDLEIGIQIIGIRA